jgi:hypothetical protein
VTFQDKGNVQTGPWANPPQEDGKSGVSGGGGGDYIEPMNERVAKLEVAVKGLRDSINIMLAVVGIVVLILLYGVARIDQLNDRVTALPNQISTDLRDITRTLAESITAAKQQIPQVILMQPPSNPIQPPPDQPPAK